MSTYVAVLDACVLFPASIRDTLLRSYQKGFYQMRWTADILEEVRRNLITNRKVTEAQAQHLIDVMMREFPEALVDQEYHNLIDTMTNHPKDRHVLAAAVACGADIIVTDNLRDFPESALNPYQIEAQSPDVFVSNFFYQNPETMTQIIKEQAQDLHRPPVSIANQLAALAIHVPSFVRLLEERLLTGE